MLVTASIRSASSSRNVPRARIPALLTRSRIASCRSPTRAARSSTCVRSATSHVSNSPSTSAVTRSSRFRLAGDENASPLSIGQAPREGGADTARSTRDHRDRNARSVDCGAVTQDFQGKRGLVLGVANRRSIAWAIAQRLAAGGAQLAFTYQGERIEKGVRELADSVGSPLVTECDVRSDDEVDTRPRRGRRGLRRGARSSRPLGRLRRRARSRGALHRHPARSLLARARRLGLLARGCRPRR